MSSFNQRECLGCGQPGDVYHYSCTYQQCGVILLNGICLNCIHGDGKPITCCECEGPLRGGFCLFCDSKAENSFTYDPNAYSSNDTSSNFNHLPQPQYETYLCKLCGNNSHYGYHCQQQFPFVYEQEPSYNQNYNDNYYPHDSPSFLCYDNCGGSHETFQCQPKDQNIDSSDFDQIQTPQYPVIHHPSQEMSEEVFQAKGNLMHSIQTFLEKFNCISFGEKPKILLQAWEKFFAIQNAQPEDTSEFDDEEHSVQYKEYLANSSNSDIGLLIREECCIEVLQTPGSGISILLAVGTPCTGSGNLYCQWELSPGSGNALCILFPTKWVVPEIVLYILKEFTFLLGRHALDIEIPRMAVCKVRKP
nr:hypothetical protein [Tanacetum cinerariifolium]